MSVTNTSVSFVQYKRNLEQDIADFIPCDDSGNMAHYQTITGKLIDCSNQSIYPNDVIETAGLAAIFIHKIQQCPQSQSRDQLCQSLQPLLETQLLSIPKEMLIEILMQLAICDLLKMRRINSYFKILIDEDPILQSKMTQAAFIMIQTKHNISSEEFKFYSQDNKLMVEINQTPCLWKINHYLAKTLLWISHLIIKNAEASELNELLTHLVDSTQISTFHLYNCEFDRGCFIRLQTLIQAQQNQSKPFILYLCKMRTLDCLIPAEYETSSSFLKLIDAKESDAYTLERILEEESDQLALNAFASKVISLEATGEEVVSYAQLLKPWILSPIISSIWHSVVMNSTDQAASKQEIQEQGWDFLTKNPHHMAIIAAIQNRL